MPTCPVFIGRQEECGGGKQACLLTVWWPPAPLAQPPVLWQSWQRNQRNKDYDATFENSRNAASGGVGGCHVQLCNFEVRGWDRPGTTCYFDLLIWCNYQPLVAGRSREGGREGPMIQLLSSVTRLEWGGAECLDKEPGMLITCCFSSE